MSGTGDSPADDGPAGDFGLTRSLAAGGRRRKAFQHLIQRETANLLARREFLECRNVFRDELLSWYQQERAIEHPVAIVHGHPVGHFEWIATQIEDLRD